MFHKKDTKREVFGQMFTELYPRLVRYATQLLGDGEEARDIVGSVMEQAWKQFEKLEPENRGAWLYTAARNACLNRLKHLQVEATNLEALRVAETGIKLLWGTANAKISVMFVVSTVSVRMEIKCYIMAAASFIHQRAICLPAYPTMKKEPPPQLSTSLS